MQQRQYDEQTQPPVVGMLLGDITLTPKPSYHGTGHKKHYYGLQITCRFVFR